jgi:DNA-binding NtrC family response regulator
MNFVGGEDLGTNTHSVVSGALEHSDGDRYVWNGRSKKPVILVVDDEISQAQILSVALKLAGFCSSFVGSAEQALAALETGRVDAVVSDSKMPGVSGGELLRKIRRDYPGLAFLLLTEVDDAHVGVQALKDGADDHLVKPIQAKILTRNLKRVLERKRVEHEVLASQNRLQQLVSKPTM